MPSPAEPFVVHARPRGRQWLALAGAALALGIGAAWLARALDPAPGGWLLPAGIGGALALAILWLAALGSSLRLLPDGRLEYAIAGRPALRVALAEIRAVHALDLGGVPALGLKLADPRRVEFVHRAAVSPAQMRRWRERHGVDLLFDGYDARAADWLRRRCPAAAPSVPSPGAA